MQAAERKRTAASIDRSVLRRKLTKLKDLYMNDLIDIDEYKKDYETYTAALSALEDPEEEKHIDLSGVRRIISHDFREISRFPDQRRKTYPLEEYLKRDPCK